MVQSIKSLIGKPAPARFRYIFLIASIFGGSFLILIISKSTDIFYLKNDISSTWYSPRRFALFDSGAIFTIKTEGCTIPGLNPFDDSIKNFIERPKKLKPCNASKLELLSYNDTHIWISSEKLNFSTNANISCCYKSFSRPSSIKNISSENVDNRVKYENCIYFSDYIKVANEFVKVSCSNYDKVIHKQFLLFAPRKPFIHYKSEISDPPVDQSGYNVVIMGIDAISRLNFYRTMPKTLSYLKKKGAIELYGYNKVGDNTLPNLSPLLLGIKDTELKKTCLPNSRSTFDNCPFIWEWFKEAGYYTALGEDSARLGTFNFGKPGFIGTPTDYYIRTFMHEAELHVGNNRDCNSFLCMGNKHFYQVLLDYVENLTRTLKSLRFFGFFWEVTMSHDYLNYPVFIDDSYERFLKNLDNSKYLDKTILILLSDHGIRWGDIRFTKQGRLEERLPFVHILLPTSFREKFSTAYNNLKINSRRLTTPFDLHSTLSDLVNVDTINNDRIQQRTSSFYAQDRSISLFLPIPSNRTCQMAGIDDHWCTCHKGKNISTSSVEATEAAAFLVRRLNVIVHSYVLCEKLELADLLEVTEMEVGTPRENEVGWREFMVTVRTMPGGAVFEATLRYDKGRWSLSGTISRLNLYGDQSRCVHNYQLKLYCYCK